MSVGVWLAGCGCGWLIAFFLIDMEFISSRRSCVEEIIVGVEGRCFRPY